MSRPTIATMERSEFAAPSAEGRLKCAASSDTAAIVAARFNQILKLFY